MRQIFAATLSILLASPCIVGTAWASVDLDRAVVVYGVEAGAYTQLTVPTTLQEGSSRWSPEH